MQYLLMNFHKNLPSNFFVFLIFINKYSVFSFCFGYCVKRLFAVFQIIFYIIFRIYAYLCTFSTHANCNYIFFHLAGIIHSQTQSFYQYFLLFAQHPNLMQKFLAQIQAKIRLLRPLCLICILPH